MEVNFFLPGLRRNYPINITFIRLLEEHPEYFRDGVKIGACFGEFPPSLWNGGRVSKPDLCDEKFINMCIRQMNDRGIAIRYTYTNMALTEEDLKDPYCNYCLQAAHNGMNGVIVVSPMLEAYVRKNYPKMHIISSTCKCIRGVEDINAELEKDYAMVVLDYNLNNRFDLLEQITDKNRCEILVNALCVPNCPYRAAHYKNISENQKIIVKNMRLPKEQAIPTNQWNHETCKGAGNMHMIQDFCTYVSPEAIWEKYVPMGFKHFKLEGRTDHIFNIIELYCHYMIKPEYQGRVRLMLLGKMEQLKIIQVNMP